VMEFVWDRFQADYGGLGSPEEPVVDPVGPVEDDGGRVFKGGAWAYDPIHCTAPGRNRADPNQVYAEGFRGIRPARTVCLPESCGDGVDNDCNGEVDEGCWE